MTCDHIHIKEQLKELSTHLRFLRLEHSEARVNHAVYALAGHRERADMARSELVNLEADIEQTLAEIEQLEATLAELCR